MPSMIPESCDDLFICVLSTDAGSSFWLLIDLFSVNLSDDCSLGLAGGVVSFCLGRSGDTAVTLFLPLLQYNTITIKIITTVTMDTVTPTMTPIFESLLSAVAEVKIKIKCHSKGIKTLSEKNQEWI